MGFVVVNQFNKYSQDELKKAFTQNNSIVLKQFYADNYSKVEAYVIANSGTNEQAKDIFQDAYSAFWFNVREGKFVPQNETALQGYLYQIAKFKWLDVLRTSRKKKVSRMKDMMIEDDSLTNTMAIENEHEQKVQMVMAAFEQLGNDCEKILKQFYFKQLSMQEIAEQFDITEHSARNKKYRCIEKLRNVVTSK